MFIPLDPAKPTEDGEYIATQALGERLFKLLQTPRRLMDCTKEILLRDIF